MIEHFLENQKHLLQNLKKIIEELFLGVRLHHKMHLKFYHFSPDFTTNKSQFVVECMNLSQLVAFMIQPCN